MAGKRSKTVKVSAALGVELHARLSAAASLRGTTRNAILVEALTESLKGIVAFDRGKPSRRSAGEDRQGEGGEISPDAPEEAA